MHCTSRGPPVCPLFPHCFVSLMQVTAVNALDARNPEPRSGLSERDNYPIIDARDFDELDRYARHPFSKIQMSN